MSRLSVRSQDAYSPQSVSLVDALKAGWSAARLRPWILSVWRRLATKVHYIRMFFWPDVVLLEGRTKSGTSLSVLRAGISDRQTAYFFVGQVFAEICAERILGRRWLWALPALARKHGCAFVIFRVARHRVTLARRILGRTVVALHLPVFVQATVDVTDRKRLLRSRSLRDDVRRIRDLGFQFTLSRKQRDLETFISEYHDPYVNKVHGFDAIAMDFQRLLASCSNDEIPENWVLLKVILGGEWVAGVLLFNGADRAALMEIGVRNGDRTLVKRKVLQAAYWLSLQYLRGQGHKRVSLMLARPFVMNGVLQYKLKFSPSLAVARPADGFLLICNFASDSTREILLREAFLVFMGDCLGAVWFSLDSAASPVPSSIPVDRLAIAGIRNVERVVLR